ncbi:MAG: hypothetical protein WC548_04265 [Candidatus Pacearchaeota archaeon]
MLEDLKMFLEKENVPCFIFLVKGKDNEPKFIEVIVKRPYRYTERGIIKKVPKIWKGVRVKVL